MNVEIQIPATRVETLENDRQNETVEEHTPTRVVIRKDVTGNPNFDAYLRPKCELVYDELGHGGRFTYGEVKYERTTGEASIEFECYPDELREAAAIRASEDHAHEVQVLAEWTYRAESEYPEVARRLQTALDKASDDNPEAQYRKEIGGGADLMKDTTDGSLEGGA